MLKNVARDWSGEGAAEREQSYGRIVHELGRLFASWPADAADPPSVLVPGCGLGRLCLEVTSLVSAAGRRRSTACPIRALQPASCLLSGAGWRPSAAARSALVPACPAHLPLPALARATHPRTAQGFRCQGNEFSYFMLLASAYLLNGVERELQVQGRGAQRASHASPGPAGGRGTQGLASTRSEYAAAG